MLRMRIWFFGSIVNITKLVVGRGMARHLLVRVEAVRVEGHGGSRHGGQRARRARAEGTERATVTQRDRIHTRDRRADTGERRPAP
jgi:hypothetical protein